MIISVILGHPDKKSFNHAIADQVIKVLNLNNHTIYYHDLYEEKFDPILNAVEIPKDGLVDKKILNYSSELNKSDGIVIIHPNWWGQPPAILKGWIDRIIRPDIAYRFDENDKGDGIPIGLLKAKIGIVFNTSNTTENREKNVFGDPLESLWKKCIFELCGVKNFYRKIYSCIVTSSLQQRKKWLLNVKDIINNKFPKI